MKKPQIPKEVLTIDNAFMFAFHGKTCTPFAIKRFSSVLYMCDMVIGYLDLAYTPF